MLFIARENNKCNLTGYHEMFEKLSPAAHAVRANAVQYCCFGSALRGISVIDG
jgi:hypothetical protein